MRAAPMLDEKAITSGTLSQRRLAWSSPIRKRPNCNGALASRLVVMSTAPASSAMAAVNSLNSEPSS